MGEVHLDDIYMKDNVNIYAVVDYDEERARIFAKKYGADKYGTEYVDFISDPNTDIVICATYPKTHLDVLKCCVKYNKHLLCEKPITPDIETAKEFVETVRNAKIKVQIGYILRHNQTYNKVAEMIHSGMLGSPLVIRMVQNHHVMDWKKYRALLEDATPIVDCGVHYIDICRWYTKSEIVEVGGISSRLDEECPEHSRNYCLMTMKLADGSIAYYEADWGATVSAANTKEFIGPKGRIIITERDNRVSCREEGDLIEFYDKETGEYKNINVNCKRRPTGAQLQHLIDMIEKDVPALPTIDDVYAGFKVATEADKAIR